MDPIPIKTLKFQANQKLKKHQKNQSLVINLFCFGLAVLSCCVFCSAPLWFPSSFSSMKVFPQMVSSVFLMSSKFVLILGNLIVVALVGESKIFSTVSSAPNIHLEYEENIKRCQRFNLSSTYKENKEPLKVMKYVVEERVVVDDKSLVEEMVMSSCEDGDQAMEKGEGCEEECTELVVDEVKEEIDEEDEEVNLHEDHHFNRRADDFISRVNERRRYELLLCNLE